MNKNYSMSAPMRVALMVGGLVHGAAAMADTAHESAQVIAQHLDNPRGLAFSTEGRLFVAQAGSFTGPSLTAVGNSGKVTEIRNPESSNPTLRNLATGLISMFDAEGETLGVDGLSAGRDGALYGIVAQSNVGVGFSPPNKAGWLLKIRADGDVQYVANVGDFDYRWSEQHQGLAPKDFLPGDSNPYAVLRDGDSVYVADAGTNTLSRVRSTGQQEILAYFPNSLNGVNDSTPTCIAKGPDGALYIGTLSLVASNTTNPQSAIVYRVDLGATDPSDFSKVLSVAKPWATNLWPVSGCAFGRDGNFYVAELSTTGGFAFTGGDVLKISFEHPNTGRQSLTNQTLSVPGGVAVGPDGSVYVTNKTSGFPGAGEVVRLRARH
jgi:glucose/arabinose dehydrogenase